MGKTNLERSSTVHMAKGKRHYKDDAFGFRPLCTPLDLIWESDNQGCTYSLKEITCKPCLMRFIGTREKEIAEAKEYLKYCKG